MHGQHDPARLFPWPQGQWLAFDRERYLRWLDAEFGHKGKERAVAGGRVAVCGPKASGAVFVNNVSGTMTYPSYILVKVQEAGRACHFYWDVRGYAQRGLQPPCRALPPAGAGAGAKGCCAGLEHISPAYMFPPPRSDWCCSPCSAAQPGGG